jgi:hypothetical protein
MKKKLQIRRASQAEILAESRKPFARKTAKHRNQKAYRREKKIVDE